MKTRLKLLSLIIVGLSLCLNAPADLNDGLIAYYKLDGNAIDESINDNDGTALGPTLTADRLGNADSAYYLDGENDRIEIPNSDSLEIREQLTLSVWIKLNSFGPGGYGNEHGYILNKGNDLWWNPTFCIGYRKDSGTGAPRWPGKPGPLPALFHVCNEIEAQQEGGRTVLSQTLLQTNMWYHIAGTYDGTNLSVYINGKLENTAAYSGLLRSDHAPVHIGGGKLYGIDWGNQFTVDGTVDDVRIYDRALAPAEIAELAEVSPFALTEGYYLFDVKANAQLLVDGKKGTAISQEKVQGILIYNANTTTSLFVYQDNGEPVVLDADFTYTPYTNSEKESKKGLSAQGAASALFNVDGFLNSVVLGAFRYQETKKGTKMTISLSGTGINTKDDICGTLRLRYNQKNSDALNSADDIGTAIQELMDSMMGKRPKK